MPLDAATMAVDERKINMGKNVYQGQEILFQTVLFGKPYFWMRDIEGTTYLAKAKPVDEASVGSDGVKVFTAHYVPDFS